MASADDCPSGWEDDYKSRLEEQLHRFGMTATHVARTLSLDDSVVLCVFLVGSRFWGTAGPRSDWDFIVVTSKCVWGAEDKPVDRHVGIVDAHILSRQHFEEGLRCQRFRYILCLHLPKVCVLRSTWKAKWSRDPRPLRDTFLAEKERDLRMAKKYFAKGERFRACKTLVHTLRMFVLGKEVVETGAMTQFGCGRDELQGFQWNTPSDWSAAQEFVDGCVATAERAFLQSLQS